MDGTEMQVWEIAKERVGDFQRERSRSRLAAEVTAHHSSPGAPRVIAALLSGLIALCGLALKLVSAGSYRW